MKKVNLRDLYPDVYKTDYFVEVTEDVLETIRAAERAEAAYDRRMYRYKAHYSLDCDNGIENAILMKPQTPEMLLEEKQLREQLYGKEKTSIRQCRCAHCEHIATGCSCPVTPALFAVGRNQNRLGRSQYRFCPAGSDPFSGMCAEQGKP